MSELFSRIDMIHRNDHHHTPKHDYWNPYGSFTWIKFCCHVEVFFVMLRHVHINMRENLRIPSETHRLQGLWSAFNLELNSRLAMPIKAVMTSADYKNYLPCTKGCIQQTNHQVNPPLIMYSHFQRIILFFRIHKIINWWYTILSHI